MKEFNLSEWLKDKSRKVVTRDGRPVRILCTDAKAKDGCCIIAAIETDGEEEGYQFYKDGRAFSSKSSIEDCADLFFADEEEKPQSIEIPFGAKDSEFVRDEYYIPEGCEARIEGNKVIIEKIQKEELTKFEKTMIEFSHGRNSLIQFEHTTEEINAHLYLYSEKLLDLARKELLKDLPKWKKATEHKDLEKHIAILEEGKVLLSNYLEEGDYYIILDDLKTLPKEE